MADIKLMAEKEGGPGVAWGTAKFTPPTVTFTVTKWISEGERLNGFLAVGTKLCVEKRGVFKVTNADVNGKKITLKTL
jgi:hypothetical protein